MSVVPGRRNSLQQEQRARTRASIMHAALEVFGEVGYVSSTVEHILGRAGVSRAAFYSHFDGKQGLVRGIAEDFTPAWRPIFEYLAQLRDPNLTKLTEWASRHVGFFRANLHACTILSQASETDEVLYAYIAKNRDAIIYGLAEHHPAFAKAKVDAVAMLEARITLIAIDEISFHIAHGHLENPDNSAERIIAGHMLRFLEK